MPLRASLSLMTAAVLAGCASGPRGLPSPPNPPVDWAAARGGGPELADARLRAAASPAAPNRWAAFGDPELDALQARATAANLDLKTAALRLAQARVQRRLESAQAAPQVNASAAATRQRASENGAATRLVEAVGGKNSGPLIELLSQPYSLVQAGFDASWELDLWGRVRRSIEAADADLAASQADLDALRVSVQAEVARAYFELRGVQQQIALTQADIAAAAQMQALLKARADGGLIDDSPVRRQGTQLADLQSRLPQLFEREAGLVDQLTLLLGQAPGGLNAELARPDQAASPDLPDLSLGVPSDLARNRPDIRAAEARLRAATARVGAATADLYPRFVIGGRFGLEALEAGDLADWGSRQWSVGPSLTLPLFDGGRRRATVTLRGLQEQAAAVAYQQAMLKAWREVDSALSGYTAERQRNAGLARKAQDSRATYELADVRYRNGLTTYLDDLDAQRSLLQAEHDYAQSSSDLRVRLAAVYKALGGAAP